MSIFGASTTARTFPRVGKGFMIAALGGALALAAIAGVGIRQATQEDSTGGAAATTRPAERTGISDQEAYQAWQQQAVTSVRAESAAVSDQEAYQAWQRQQQPVTTAQAEGVAVSDQEAYQAWQR